MGSRQSQSWGGENTAHCQNHINFNGFPVHLTPHQQRDLASLHHEPPGCGGQEKGGSGLAPVPVAQRKPWDILWDIFENTGCLFQDICALIVWKLSIDLVTSQHPPPAWLSHSTWAVNVTRALSKLIICIYSTYLHIFTAFISRIFTHLKVLLVLQGREFQAGRKFMNCKRLKEKHSSITTCRNMHHFVQKGQKQWSSLTCCTTQATFNFPKSVHFNQRASFRKLCQLDFKISTGVESAQPLVVCSRA